MVDRNIAGKFIPALQEKIKHLRVGDPMVGRYGFGPTLFSFSG